MPHLTTAKAIVKSLIQHGIDTIYCLPGVQNDQLFNALHDETDNIRVIHTRHEQGAAYMALGASLATGKPAVYSVVPGPGFLNTTAALATSYSSNARVLCLTGQIPSRGIGRGYGLLHEIPNQLDIIKQLTKWAKRIGTAAEAPLSVNEAFEQMSTGRTGPVGLECPMDVLGQAAEVEFLPPVNTFWEPPVDGVAIDKAIALLRQAERPVIFVGGGAQEASAEVLALAEYLQAPVVAGRTGRGVLDSRHYLSLTSPAGHQLWRTADVVLGVGTRLQVPQMQWGVDDALKIIRIDINPEEINRINPADVGIVATAKSAVGALHHRLQETSTPRPSRKGEMDELRALMAKEFESVAPQLAWLDAIRAELPEDGILVEDLTQVSYVSRFAFPVYRPRTFLTPGYQGTLGWSFATALGAKVANPDVPVVAIAGDGGFMFTVQELATAVQHKIGLVTIVFADGAFGNVRRMQKELYGNRVIATDLQNPSFSGLAELFGARGVCVESPDQLRVALRESFQADMPTIIEVPLPSDAFPDPWHLINLPRVRPANDA